MIGLDRALDESLMSSFTQISYNSARWIINIMVVLFIIIWGWKHSTSPLRYQLQCLLLQEAFTKPQAELLLFPLCSHESSQIPVMPYPGQLTIYSVSLLHLAVNSMRVGGLLVLDCLWSGAHWRIEWLLSEYRVCVGLYMWLSAEG